MEHLGDITKIDGAAVQPVNVIIGGSPCQDLSIAGKRKGLQGERSGLFMEQLRIIKEMRKADADRGRTGKNIRPRFMVWENVPGAFSSNKGEDFGAVLQETIKVVYKEAPIIPKPKNGWPTSGCLTDVGGQWSLAWRVLDAQFWGVPQRRRRIALIADFGGSSAPEILFERKSMSGDSEESREKRERTPTNAQTSITGNDKLLAGKGRGLIPCTLKIRSGCEGGGKGALIQVDKSATLSTLQDQTLFQPTICIQGNCIDRADTAGCNGKGWREDVSYTLNTIDRPAVVQSAGFKSNQGVNAHGIAFEKDVSPTLAAGKHDACVAIAIENHPNDSRVKLSEDNIVQTLSSRMGTGGGNTPMVLECYSQNGFTKYQESGCASTLRQSGGDQGDQRHLLYQNTIGSLCARDSRGVGNQYVQENKLIVEVINENTK